jgi:hypothetical protein
MVLSIILIIAIPSSMYNRLESIQHQFLGPATGMLQTTSLVKPSATYYYMGRNTDEMKEPHRQLSAVN